MITIKGKGVYGGIARGFISFYRRNELVINKRQVKDTQKEFEKYINAKKDAIDELKNLFRQVKEDVGNEDAQIFCIQQMILKDSQFENVVRDYIIQQGFNSEYAVAKAAKAFSERLANMGTDYVKERIADVKDATERVIRVLQNRTEEEPAVSADDNKCIICADDLMPSETASIDKSKVVAFCTKHGSVSSHTAILSRTMNIPAIIGIGDALCEDYDGKYAVVDGYAGIIYIEPDKKTLHMLDQKEETEGRKKEILRRLKGRKNITLDGKEINVFANIHCLSDAASAIENDAAGIGLFRSEFMYLNRSDYPDEEYLFYNYRRVLEDMHGKPVTIRTLDIGADKMADYFGLEPEENPALGIRAIRVCLKQQEVFKTQLRALLRASVYGSLGILIPFITDVSEILEVKKIIKEVKNELDNKGIPYSHKFKLGIMIETPAAVVTSDLLANEVDFFSIGTNDLEQYTLAIDRQHPYCDDMGPGNNLAVLRMIKEVCDNAHAKNIPVCICGELAGDTELTELFLDMHIDSLSVAPSNILPIRKTVRSIDLSDRWKIHNNFRKYLRLWS